MSDSDREAGGSSLPGRPPGGAPDALETEADERQREPFWMVAISSLLLVGAGLMFASLPVISSGGRRSRKPRRSSPSEAPGVPTIVVEGAEEPHGEPWWLIAFTAFVVIGVGLLLIFYAHLPPFPRY